VQWVFLSCEIALYRHPASDNIFKTSVSAEIKCEFCKWTAGKTLRRARDDENTAEFDSTHKQ
jgi:hypothetical protein